jgi:hypothetical protein
LQNNFRIKPTEFGRVIQVFSGEADNEQIGTSHPCFGVGGFGDTAFGCGLRAGNNGKHQRNDH